ncbi:MAG: hypothetical protein WHS46_13480 [Desulfosoma sp.]
MAAFLSGHFLATIGLLYDNTLRLMEISNEIVNKHHRLLDIAKVMVEQLLIMEEKEKKHILFQSPRIQKSLSRGHEPF